MAKTPLAQAAPPRLRTPFASMLRVVPSDRFHGTGEPGSRGAMLSTAALNPVTNK
jgi:hypothetical protein